MTLPDEFFDLVSDPQNEPDEADQTEFDLEFYQLVLKQNDQHIDVLRRLVEILARRGHHASALELDERIVKLRPGDSVARYNLACSLSMLGHVQLALAALDEALQRGYGDLAHMETDPDLQSVRRNPAYIELLEKHGLLP